MICVTIYAVLTTQYKQLGLSVFSHFALFMLLSRSFRFAR